MIRALAHGGQVLGQPEYTAAAERAATFLLHRHASADGGLARTSGGVATASPATCPPIAGFLDDYAFLAQALLALGGTDWRIAANRIIGQMIDRFGDPDSVGGFFFTDASATELLVRQKTGADSPISSGNSVAALVLLATGRSDSARQTLIAFAEAMNAQGEGMSTMINAAMRFVDEFGPIAVAASADTDPANRPASPQAVAEDVVHIGVTQTSGFGLDVELMIRPGWHLNAHDVSGPVPLVATTVTVEGGASIDQISAGGGTYLRVHGQAPVGIQRAARDRRAIRGRASIGRAPEFDGFLPGMRRLHVPAAGKEADRAQWLRQTHS